MTGRPAFILKTTVIVGTALLVAGRWEWLRGADPVPDPYSPVVRAEPLLAAFQGHLKEAREWVLDKDYPSAAQSAQALAALTHLLSHHYSSADSQARVKDLRESIDSLAGKIKEKDQSGCLKAVTKCGSGSTALAALPEEADKASIKNYKPQGSTRTWMLLMDAAYVDGKSTKDPRTFEQQALALAEEVNASSFLRTDARWRQLSREVRDLALDAARKARESDLATARLTLKRANDRCEACHQGYRR
jgi:hypothetical protein